MLPPFLTFLIQKKLLTEEQGTALAEKYESGTKTLDVMLVESKILDTDEVLAEKGEFYHLPTAALLGTQLPREAVDLLPKEITNNYQITPFAVEDDTVRVAMVNPENLKAREAVDFLARQHGWNTQYYVTTSQGLAHVLDRQSGGLRSEVKEALVYADQASEEKTEKLEEEASLEEVVKSAPVSKMVSVILRHAVEGNASDIHIEPGEDETRVRYRIDGELHSTLMLPKYIHASIVSRIKVMANLKLDETRKPQDGRIHMRIGDREIDFRVSTLPLTGSEKVVMRILDVTRGAPKLEDLGFMGRNLEVIYEELKKPHGLFLVTGPTGSGKSTTLFSALSLLNKEHVNIITLEDPVEYYLPGANQSQVRPEVGYNFASGLRSILRQDPDIIMVGEIRDNETAQLAVQAALTGHIVFSTLHTNDASGALPRLLDMKVESFLLSNTINLVLAQRLVRKVCQACKEPYEIHPDLLKIADRIFAAIPPDLYYEGITNGPKTFYHGKGCDKCGGTGYIGRLSISEAVVNTRAMQQIIAKGFDRTEAEKELAAQKFITIIQDGIMKSLMGLTTVDEVVVATKE